MFPKIGVPQNGWSIMEHPIRMDDLEVPLFLETPIQYGNIEVSLCPSFPHRQHYQRYKVSKVDSRRSPTASTSKTAGANNQPGMVGLFQNATKFVHHDDPPRFFRDVLFFANYLITICFGKSG